GNISCLDENDNIYSLTGDGMVKKIDTNGQFVGEYELPQQDAFVNSRGMYYHSGNFYVIGMTDEVNFGTPGTFRPQKPVGSTFIDQQFFLMKTDADFQRIWATFLPNNNHTQNGAGNKNIIIDENENIYVNNYTLEEDLSTSGVFQEDKN